MRDKDVDAVVGALAGIASHLCCTAPRTGRAMAPDDLAAIACRYLPADSVSAHQASSDAVRYALAHGAPVVVAGSLYLAGEVRAEVS
jgi:folylpolyglutamate synthase/dihydropteroate synthase